MAAVASDDLVNDLDLRTAGYEVRPRRVGSLAELGVRDCSV
jgi:hypothetical protein